jgi:hypothetical protein
VRHPCDMDATIVLNIGSSANANVIHIPAHTHVKPDIALVTNVNIPNHRRIRRNINTLPDGWEDAFVREDEHEGQRLRVRG